MIRIDITVEASGQEMMRVEERVEAWARGGDGRLVMFASPIPPGETRYDQERS
jgi:hypothetical protein